MTEYKWTKGNRTLEYVPSDSEFAGGCEAGTYVELGHFFITEDGKPETWPNFYKVRSYTVHDRWEYAHIIETFLATGQAS